MKGSIFPALNHRCQVFSENGRLRLLLTFRNPSGQYKPPLCSNVIARPNQGKKGNKIKIC